MAMFWSQAYYVTLEILYVQTCTHQPSTGSQFASSGKDFGNFNNLNIPGGKAQNFLRIMPLKDLRKFIFFAVDNDLSNVTDGSESDLRKI